jgi:hypothetical protein
VIFEAKASARSAHPPRTARGAVAAELFFFVVDIFLGGRHDRVSSII